MHIVTKFLVVIAAVLSVLLAGLTIAYSSNAKRITGDLAGLRAEIATLNAEISSVRADNASQLAKWQEERDGLEDLNAQLADTNRRLQANQQELIAEKRQLELEQSVKNAQLTDANKTIETITRLSEKLSEELGTLRERELSAQKREIALVDRISDLEGRLEVTDETNRALQEQLVEYRDEIDRLRSGGATASAADEGDLQLRAPSNFRARITDVRNDGQGNVLAAIDAGSSDRLRKNMKLNIVRDGFLATLIIERVDQNEAVGRVNFLGRDGVNVRVGDLVLSTSI